jgi:hypothetical protein
MGPVTVRSICFASRVARLINYFLPDVVSSFTIMPNLKFALRTLFKTPFVTTVAIVSGTSSSRRQASAPVLKGNHQDTETQS